MELCVHNCKCVYVYMIMIMIIIIITERQLMLTCIVKQQMELKRTLSIAAWRIMAGVETTLAAGKNGRQ